VTPSSLFRWSGLFRFQASACGVEDKLKLYSELLFCQV
jgi:hypothetical protein